MSFPEIKLGPVPYHWKGELAVKSNSYKFVPTEPVTFPLRDPWGGQHETTLRRDLSNHVIIHWE